MIKSVGSVCSGIEAASVAWKPFGVQFEWFSEIADFPSRILAERYPTVKNVGDMCYISKLLFRREIAAPDLICAGTPCQAFSLAGQQNGLKDNRGNLSLKFVDIIDENDKVRSALGQPRCKVFWENVEGVLTDKTNAFGCMISSLAGLDDVLESKGGKWPSAGLLQGPKRNVAWRVLDAKYFGLPQQRKRLYLVAGGKEFSPETILFEIHRSEFPSFPSSALAFEKEGCHFEVFREYTDCLYSAYGTKWNGNAAAYNGSLFVVQDSRIRRLSPLECERLMGFPDHYTNLPKAKKTNRYQVIGNSWAVPVVRWIGNRLICGGGESFKITNDSAFLQGSVQTCSTDIVLFDFERGLIRVDNNTVLNCTSIPEKCSFTSLPSIISPDAPEDIYISPVGCFGIIRRKRERNLSINPRLETILLNISSQMRPEEIEKRSRIQHRGRFSDTNNFDAATKETNAQNKFLKGWNASHPESERPFRQLSIFDDVRI